MANSTLLLADDSVTIQKVVNLTFAGEGIDVIAVGDGNSAMDILRESLPDIVLADVNMPGLNGYEICEKVKSMDGGAPVPVILLVGSFEPFDSEEASRVGADAHLTKPFESIAALVDTVHDLIGGGSPGETPRFDDTVEYPTGSDIVLGPDSMPFAGGFEDETIEAETFGDPAEERPEEASAETEQAAFDASETGEQEWNAPGDAGGTFTDLSEEAPSEEEVVRFDEPVAAEFAETHAADESRVEVEYGESSYSESISYSEPAEDRAEPIDDSFSPEPFEPEPEEQPAYGFQENEPDLGPMTVELDEADLLELPVDLSSPEPDETESGESFETAPASSDWEEPVPYEDMEQHDEGAPEEAHSFEEEAPVPAEETRSYYEAAPSFEEEAQRIEEETPVFASEAREQTEIPEYSDTPEYVETPEHTETPIESYEPEEKHEERFEATIREVAFQHTTSEAVSGPEITDELVEAIARRVVEKLSDKAVREIAWEVVPDMAEIIIRKMVEERMDD